MFSLQDLNSLVLNWQKMSSHQSLSLIYYVYREGEVRLKLVWPKDIGCYCKLATGILPTVLSSSFSQVKLLWLQKSEQMLSPSYIICTEVNPGTAATPALEYCEHRFKLSYLMIQRSSKNFRKFSYIGTVHNRRQNRNNWGIEGCCFPGSKIKISILSSPGPKYSSTIFSCT